MGTHMKTTIEISEALFLEAKRQAAKNGTTLRALIEQGLKQALKDSAKTTTHQPRDGRVKGKGLTPEAKTAGWRAVLDEANER